MSEFILTGFVGWKKEYNPVLASPKVVTKVDEPVVDVVLSVSQEDPLHHIYLKTYNARTLPRFVSERLGLWFASGTVVPSESRMSPTFLILTPPLTFVVSRFRTPYYPTPPIDIPSLPGSLPSQNSPHAMTSSGRCPPMENFSFSLRQNPRPH